MAIKLRCHRLHSESNGITAASDVRMKGRLNANIAYVIVHGQHCAKRFSHRGYTDRHGRLRRLLSLCPTLQFPKPANTGHDRDKTDRARCNTAVSTWEVEFITRHTQSADNIHTRTPTPPHAAPACKTQHDISSCVTVRRN